MSNLYNQNIGQNYRGILNLDATTINTPLDGTLRVITDGMGNASPLQLSTTGIQFGSSTGLFWNNTTSRLGIGTNSPLGVLHLKTTGATTRLLLDGDAGQSKIITFRTNGLQRFGLYVNNVAESGANAGSNFLIRAYNDAGTLLSTPLTIERSSGNVGIGTTAPNASSILDVTSTTKGFLMPRMTYAQMKAISTPATGLQVYNTDNNTPQVYDGTGYQILGTSVVTATVSAGATTLSCDNGNMFSVTLVNGTPTAITLSNARPGSYIIRLLQPAGGSSTVTWSTTIVWAGGTAPTLTTTANYLDIITLIYDGTTWRGVATLNFAS